MIRKKATTTIAFKKEKLQLRCEWDQCDYLCDDSPLLYQHVRKHLNDDLTFVETNQCPWTECAETLSGTSELRTHVFYHAFHTKIKCFGQNLLDRQDAPTVRCLMDKSSRNMIPDTPDKYRCQWTDCDDCFENPEAFYAHVDCHAEEVCDGARPSKKAPCGWSSCDATFATVHKLKEHVRTHTQEKRLACPNCGGVFWSRTKLLDHFERQDERSGHNCIYCSRSFSSERLLRDHMRHHVNQYKCPLCDMTCPTPSAVKNHMQWRHTSLRPYACDQCDYAAKQQCDLRKHIQIMHSNKSLACPYAGCDFVERSTHFLRNHVRDEHLKCPKGIYMCHICQKQYTKGNSLSRHLVSQHRFKWPSGHMRFNYCCNKDNIFTVQTVRYESLDLAEARTEIPGEMNADTTSTLSEPQVLAAAVTAEVSERPVKLVQIVQTNEDGSTVVQVAEVLAERPFELAQGMQAHQSEFSENGSNGSDVPMQSTALSVGSED
ncbi:hypothetical protein HPB51_024656 [Rhipicephalus microplus]|uniref:C2H2-type domain-containing protein n=1 Tax=Rhipicephalus microplus TaxID=6941 RepID=A0A9J6DR79_RHIMP|nr:histone H4 transcription factor-like [Rhipicephalus microplus]KAH8024454.1 hypothetical protein HPB51_024656 [Rhipicephalus microplus]